MKDKSEGRKGRDRKRGRTPTQFQWRVRVESPKRCDLERGGGRVRGVLIVVTPVKGRVLTSY